VRHDSDETIVAFLTANPNIDTIELQINSPGAMLYCNGDLQHSQASGAYIRRLTSTG